MPRSHWIKGVSCLLHVTDLCRQACPDQAAGTGGQGGPPSRALRQTGHQGRGGWGSGAVSGSGPRVRDRAQGEAPLRSASLPSHSAQERLAQRAMEKEERMTHDTKRAAKDRREVGSWQGGARPCCFLPRSGVSIAAPGAGSHPVNRLPTAATQPDGPPATARGDGERVRAWRLALQGAAAGRGRGPEGAAPAASAWAGRPWFFMLRGPPLLPAALPSPRKGMPPPPRRFASRTRLPNEPGQAAERGGWRVGDDRHVWPRGRGACTAWREHAVRLPRARPTEPGFRVACRVLLCSS